MVKVVVVNGAPRSGKDTFVDFCIEENHKRNGHTLSISMVDKAKLIAMHCGWGGEKTPRTRKFLSDLKDLIDEAYDASFEFVRESINFFSNKYEEEKNNIIFVMARQPKDIDRLKEVYNAVAICVRRDAAEQVETSNHADANVLDYNYDYYIDNNGDLENLRAAAEAFVDELGEE